MKGQHGREWRSRAAGRLYCAITGTKTEHLFKEEGAVMEVGAGRGERGRILEPDRLGSCTGWF